MVGFVLVVIINKIGIMDEFKKLLEEEGINPDDVMNMDNPENPKLDVVKLLNELLKKNIK